MTTGSRLAATALGLLLALGLGCSNDGDGGGADALLAAWKKAGLETTEFKKVEAGSLGGSCRAGTVAGLETTVCVYPDAAKAKLAEAAGLATLGDIPTGVSVARGKLLLVVADRKSADPTGKKIAQITKVLHAK